MGTELLQVSPRVKVLAGAFMALNLVTVGFINCPDGPRRSAELWIRSNVSAGAWWTLETWGWRLRSYAHAVGLDNRWVMFSSVYRTDWHLQIRARYRDGSTRLLPVPLQGERSFWQHHFADFREAKFHLNIYGDTRAKNAYASQLAREFPSWNGAPIDAISFEIHERPFLGTPEEAAAQRTHFAGEPRVVLLALCSVSL